MGPKLPVPPGPLDPVQDSWITRRRNLMLTSALRGTCYGIGAGAVGLIFWWCEQSL
ncbi:hypothetical protein AB0D97_30735 [Streptomyces roseus]|uniref:hypothetical protein n=1 Tax=Streptomyces roseus TaxID=66430 RepID=UPI003404EB5E